MSSSLELTTNKSWPKTLRALSHRSFRFYWFGQIISQTGNWMQIVAQGWLVYQLTTSPFMLGLVSIIGLIPVVPVSLLGGVISDRLSRRKLIIATETVLMMQALALAWLIWQDTIEVWHVIVFSFVLGAASSLEQPARLAFINDTVGEVDLTNAIALNTSVYSIARIIGPMIAGVLMGSIGAAGCFLVNGISYTAVILALLIVRVQENSTPKAAPSIKHSLMDGFRYVWKTQTVGKLLLFVGVASFFALPYITLLPVFAEDVLGAGAQGLGWLTTMIGIGAIGGALSVANIPSGHSGGWLLVSNVIASTALVVFSMSDSYAISLVLLVWVGAGNAIRNITANSLLQLNTDLSYQGRVMSIYNLLFNGMSRGGALIIGGLADFIGVSWAVGLGAAVSVIFGLSAIWLMPQVRRLQ